jgi:hypothetical protein
MSLKCKVSHDSHTFHATGMSGKLPHELDVFHYRGDQLLSLASCSLFLTLGKYILGT